MKTIIDFKNFKDEEELENYINTNKFTDVEILNLEKVGNGFLYHNKKLKSLRSPNLKEAGNNFLLYNKNLESLIVPNLEIVGDSFLYHNENLKTFIAPKLKKAGDYFLYHNETLHIYNIKTKIKTVAEKNTIVFKTMRTGEIIKLLLKKGTKIQIHDEKARAEYLFAIKDVDYKSFYDGEFDKKYNAGDKIEPDCFDEKYLTCSSGIHFFFNEKDAMNYYI